MEAAAQIAGFMKKQTVAKVEQTMSDDVLKLKRSELAIKNQMAFTDRLRATEKIRLRQLEIELENKRREKFTSVFYEEAKKMLNQDEFKTICNCARNECTQNVPETD